MISDRLSISNRGAISSFMSEFRSFSDLASSLGMNPDEGSTSNSVRTFTRGLLPRIPEEQKNARRAGILALRTAGKSSTVER